MTTTINFNPISMLHRIKQAENYDELLALSVESDGYEYASDKIRRKWKRANLARKEQLLKGNKKSESKPKPTKGSKRKN